MIRQTSIDAYNKIKSDGLLSEKRWQVYDVLFSGGPLTAGEISEQLPKKISRTIGSNVHARLAELKEMGCVEELGERVCSISGMRVLFFDVNSKIPKPFKKTKETNRKIWVEFDLFGAVMKASIYKFEGGACFKECE